MTTGIIADSVRENSDKNYSIRGKKFLLTYRTHLDKDRIFKFLESSIGEIKEIHIGWEDKDDEFKYEHTHVALWLKQRASSNIKNIVNVWEHKDDDGTNENIHPEILNVCASRKDWLRVCQYISKKDIELAEFHDMIVDLINTGKQIVDDIKDCKDLESVYELASDSTELVAYGTVWRNLHHKDNSLKDNGTMLKSCGRFSIKRPILDILIGDKSITEFFSDWFNHYLEIMVENVSDNYGINKEELTKIIQNTLDGIRPPQTSIAFQAQISSKKQNDQEVEEEHRCHHIMKGGQRIGQQCTKKISKDSTKFCLLHKKNDEVSEIPAEKTLKKKRKVIVDSTGTLVDEIQGIVYYKEEDTFWAVGKKRSDSFKIIPLDSRLKRTLIHTFEMFKHNDRPPIFKVADLLDEDKNWINVIVESQRDENTLLEEKKEEWKEWVLGQYLSMRDSCLSGMDSKMFYGTFEIKLPSFVPDDYDELKYIKSDDVEYLHNENLIKETIKGLDLGDSDETLTIQFVKCLINNPSEAYKFKYKLGLAYVFYEELKEKEKENYILNIKEKKEEWMNFDENHHIKNYFVDTLYEVINR